MAESERLVRVDSAEEQYAYMIARFGDQSGWSVTSQMFDEASDGREVERVSVSLPTGETVNVAFVSTRQDSPFEVGDDEAGTEFLDTVMEAASAFSAANPPHHPGTLSRFPVPSASYSHSLAVPMAVLAVDSGRRGIYAPPRVVVIAYDSLEARGAGEFPGFDPESWPPPRMGDWPPTALAGMPRQQMQCSIMRFSAVWKRVLDAWFAQDVIESPDLDADVQDALELIDRLDVPAIIPVYTRLNPVFWKWLQRHSAAG